MATASNTTVPPRHSPRASAGGSGHAAAAVSSPKSRRSSSPRGSSPWTQIVRGGESESPPSSTANTSAASVTTPSSKGASPELVADASSDWSAGNNTALVGVGVTSSCVPSEEPLGEGQMDSLENDGGNNAGKKPVWNRPSNGAADVSPVMGAFSWPALSESTKASPKSSSTDSLKNLPDGSASGQQVIGMGPVSSPRQVSSNHANPSSTPNHVAPAHQRSMKHRGGGNNSALANGGFLQAPPPQGVGETAPNSSGKTGHSHGESSSRDTTTHKEGGQRGSFGSQPHSGGEHHQQRNSFRRGNSGSHPRGDGSHHHNYGNRRDHDRGNQERSSQRNFGGRDAHTQHQRGTSRPFMQGPPHANTPYVLPPPLNVRPFGAPMVFPEVSSPVFYVTSPHPDFRAVPMPAPMAPVFIPVADPHLPMKIVNQIEYYFSNENLVKDTYLRQNMDEQGWVSIKLIANFKKVQQLTDDIQLILTVLQSSNVVEVEGEKVRRRDDWTKWIIPCTDQYSPVSSPQSLQRSGSDLLAEHIQGVVDKKMRDVHAAEYPSRLSSGEFSNQSHVSGTEMSGMITAQSGQPSVASDK